MPKNAAGGGTEKKEKTRVGGSYRAVTEFCLVRKLINERNRSERTGKAEKFGGTGKIFASRQCTLCSKRNFMPLRF